jgi:hypothetical protein
VIALGKWSATLLSAVRFPPQKETKPTCVSLVVLVAEVVVVKLVVVIWYVSASMEKLSKAVPKVLVAVSSTAQFRPKVR